MINLKLKINTPLKTNMTPGNGGAPWNCKLCFFGVHASFRGCSYGTSTRWWVGEHGIHNFATAHYEKRSPGHTLQEEGKRSTKTNRVHRSKVAEENYVALCRYSLMSS